MTLLSNSAKPILFVTTEFEGSVKAVEMAEIVMGGDDALRRNPFCSLHIHGTAPLVHNEETLGKLLFMAEKGLPCHVYTGSAAHVQIIKPRMGKRRW